jgi:amino acid transporter
VSITAGTIAITSAARSLLPYRVEIALALVAFVTLMNLRGVKEASTLFAVPTYGFVAMVAITLATGFVRCLAGCPVAETADLPLRAEHALSVFLVLRAFSSGATALTGVEAIADGVQAFRRPQARNAATTLLAMGVMSVTMFIGITVLADRLGVRVNEEIAAESPVLAQVGQSVFGRNVVFLLLQGFTAGILILAANTAYQDFPRLSSILARDRFMPSQFRNRGDRLVFSNGVVALAVLAGILIWAFDAELTRLIQLYVVGVFTAFTLSQTGMVRRWIRLKGDGWQRSAVINGIGAATTGVVLVIVATTKFAKGAWIVIAAMPVIVLFFLAVSRHYRRIGEILRSRRLSARDRPDNTFLLLVPDLGPATLDAAGFLLAVRPERWACLYVGPPERFEEVREEWRRRSPRLGELELLAGSHEHLARSVRAFVRARRHAGAGFVTVLIPEMFTGRSWLQLLRRRAEFVLKTSLLFEPGVCVADLPRLPTEEPIARGGRSVEPARTVALIPVSAVHDPTVRAVAFARSLNPTEVRGLFFATDPEEVREVIEGWHDRELDVPLVIVEAPFRDLGRPLLDEIRAETSRGGTVVTVVMPELIPRHWWENLLHNQTAFYIKRLLLFEPDVVLASVPFHLRAPEVSG